MTARNLLAAVLLGFGLLTASWAADDPLPVVLTNVEHQPLAAQAGRVAAALEMLGAPLGKEANDRLKLAIESKDHDEAIKQIQAVLDPLCLAAVNINPESRVKVAVGPVAKQLVQQGWTVFLVKVHNEAGVTAELRASSPNAQLPYRRSSGRPDPPPGIQPHEVENRWLDLTMHNSQPLSRTLSGLALEYRIIQLYSRDAGKREAKLAFDVGQGTQDLGFRNELDVLFECRPAVEVKLEVIDDNGQPIMGQFVIRDERGRIYPAMTKRLAPDFFFHPQIYRAHGETVLLPPGKFRVSYTRGPEYRTLERDVTVHGYVEATPASSDRRPTAEQLKNRDKPKPQTESFRLKRWIKLADQGWYSGDHHVHAAGCAHYDSPTEGVRPEDMMRHILGEDLNVGCVLSWGPCWYAQKDFFEGKVHELSRPQYLMRYDVEVSGFPSSPNGHLCLLRLKEDDYPGTTRIEEWPSWNLPVLKWGKEQGGVVGYSHSGWGLAIKEPKLLSYEMPPFDGIGANEFIVDVVHDVCDFISSVDTPIHYELNIWYHTLNCGYTTRISGETDFPCIYGERVGLGRVYVKLDQELDFDRWVVGIRDGRSYVSDGFSHLLDFTANGLGVGKKGQDGRTSVLATKAGEPVKIKVRAAALLGEKPDDALRRRPLEQKPYWHVERARIGDTRRIPVELVVNGEAVERKEIDADGDINDLAFEFTPKQSSWVALRVFASSHTNPIFVEVDGKPIRASRKSAQWCLDAVDVCWNAKRNIIRAPEREAAAAAYDVARQAYRKILDESTSE
ncbi:MAG: CehA/McbA family metallohydrolase [Pirellulales bacterium]